MLKIFCIAFGGALGALCRVSVASHLNTYHPTNLPVGTIGVNLIGCFFIGFFWHVFQNFSVPGHYPLFVFSGFLGALTTFSTYTLETFHFFRDGNVPYALFYLAISNMLGLLMVSGGYMVSSYGTRLVK